MFLWCSEVWRGRDRLSQAKPWAPHTTEWLSVSSVGSQPLWEATSSQYSNPSIQLKKTAGFQNPYEFTPVLIIFEFVLNLFGDFDWIVDDFGNNYFLIGYFLNLMLRLLTPPGSVGCMYSTAKGAPRPPQGFGHGLTFRIILIVGTGGQTRKHRKFDQFWSKVCSNLLKFDQNCSKLFKIAQTW